MLELTKPINAGHKIPVTIYFNNYIYIIWLSSAQPPDNCLRLPNRNGLIILVQKNIFHTYLLFLLEKFLFLAKFKKIHMHFFFLSISLKSKVISLPLSLSLPPKINSQFWERTNPLDLDLLYNPNGTPLVSIPMNQSYLLINIKILMKTPPP